MVWLSYTCIPTKLVIQNCDTFLFRQFWNTWAYQLSFSLSSKWTPHVFYLCILSNNIWLKVFISQRSCFKTVKSNAHFMNLKINAIIQLHLMNCNLGHRGIVSNVNLIFHQTVDRYCWVRYEITDCTKIFMEMHQL